MSPVLASFKKYRASSILFPAACFVIIPAIVATMWRLRDSPLDSGLLLIFLIFPLGLGAIVGHIELGAMQMPLVWCLPGHLHAVRTLIARIGLCACAPTLVALILREDPLSAPQLASVLAASLFLYCLGLTPRVFPFAWPLLFVVMGSLFVLQALFGNGAVLLLIGRLVLEFPVVVIVIAAVACRLCWLRLGDRNRIHAFLQIPHPTVFSSSRRRSTHEWRRCHSGGKNSDGKPLAGRKAHRWLMARIGAPSTASWKRRLLGAVAYSCEAGAIWLWAVAAFFPGTVVFVSVATDSMSGNAVGGLCLRALVAIPVLFLLFALIGVAFDLLLQPQASLLLPTSRRDLLKSRWVVVACLFALGVCAVVSQLAVGLLIRTFLPEAGLEQDTREYRELSWPNLFYLAVVAPAMAACCFALRVDRKGKSEAVSGLRIVVVTALTCLAICLTAAAFMTLQPRGFRAFLWLGAAGLWAVAVPLLRRCTLNRDVPN